MAAVAVGVVAAVAAGGFGVWHLLQSRSKTATPPTVKVGVMMAFTGGSSSMGYGEMKGIQLAQKQLSADNIELVQMDSQCDAKVSPDAIKRLVQQQVVAIIGDGCSSASVAALPTANENKIPMISPSASSPKLSIADDYFFRVVPPDNFQGAYLAQSVWNKGIKTVSIFYTDEPYGTAMNNVFTQKFQALGGKVITSVGAASDVINLQTQINAIKTATFKQSLLSAYGGEQLYAAAQGYDAFEAVYLAVKNGATTGAAIKNYLPKESFDGVSAHIKFDHNGEISDAAYKYALLTVKDGSFVAQ
jgi:ABC-type branched-subunit amino acid transport system substrate-binding protein